MKEIRGKLCIVTGAAKSIGFGIAERFSELGAKVILLDIDPLVIESAKKIADKGRDAEGYVLDISNQESVFVRFKEINDRLGSAYCLVNVAGIVSQKKIEEVTTNDWEKMMAVNVYGSFYCIQAVLAGMKEQKDGKIINFASKSGKTGSALMVPYSSAKGAIITMTQAIAYEVADYNIKVNAICPGIVDETGVWDSVSEGYIKNLKMDKDKVVTKFASKIPLGRLARIEDIVDYCEFLARSGEYCTGQALNISGGREMH